MRKLVVYFVVAMSTANLAGCATESERTMADLMREQASTENLRADVKEQIAADWEKGTELVDSGKKNVEAGENLIESARRDMQRAREQIELGNRQIAEGSKIIRDSERRYQETLSEEEPAGSNIPLR